MVLQELNSSPRNRIIKFFKEQLKLLYPIKTLDSNILLCVRDLKIEKLSCCLSNFTLLPRPLTAQQFSVFETTETSWNLQGDNQKRQLAAL